VSQQVCPSCATANSTYASVCRSCSAPLTPRPPSSDASSGFAVYGNDGGGAAPAPASPPPPVSLDFQAGPRSAPGEEGGWPAERLSLSSHQVWASNGWTGVPRVQPHTPRAHVPPVWGPPPAPGPTRSDGRSAAPARITPALPPAVPPPAPRAAMAFHLDGGAGPALAAAPRMSAPTSSPAPPVAATAALASTVPAPTDAGGCGWGIREQRPSMYPAGTPIPAAAGSTGRPSAGGPSAGGAYAGVGVHPEYGYPAQPVVSAPRVGRSRTVLRVLVLLIFVALVAAGAFLYLRSVAA